MKYFTNKKIEKVKLKLRKELGIETREGEPVVTYKLESQQGKGEREGEHNA